MFELTLSKYLPNVQKSKVPRLCKTRWIERHTCLEVFLELYVALITFLDAIVSPGDYPDLATDDVGSWNWDRDTKVKAAGLKASFPLSRLLQFLSRLKIFSARYRVLLPNCRKEIRIFWWLSQW